MSDKIPFHITRVGSGSGFIQKVESMVSEIPPHLENINRLGLEDSYAGINTLRFVEQPIGGTPSYYDVRSDSVHIYPLMSHNGDTKSLLCHAFGTRMFETRLTSDARLKWNKKMVRPDRAVMDRISNLLDGSMTYREILACFHSACEKLQTIHILNALIANAISHAKAATISIYDYPPTQEFALCDREYSLIPLVDAYSGDKYTKYADAFAAYVCGGGIISIPEHSVQKAVTKLFESITMS